MAVYTKPLPIRNMDTMEYWEGCKRHQLVIQKCKDCGTFRHVPRPMCGNCGSMNAEFTSVSGKGKIYSFTIVTHPVHPAFKDVPYALVVVELPDAGGVVIMSNLIDCPVDEIEIGMPVEVAFVDVSPTITLPQFQRDYSSVNLRHFQSIGDHI